MKKLLFALVLLIVAGVAWYAFRPERLFINQKVNEQFPTASAANNTKPIASGQFHRGSLWLCVSVAKLGSVHQLGK